MCHAKDTLWGTLATAGRDVVLDNAFDIRRHASLIETTTVRSDAMPPGNITDMA